jgi:hypothetical protein
MIHLSCGQPCWLLSLLLNLDPTSETEAGPLIIYDG